MASSFLLNLGDVCVKLKDVKKACEYYERVIQIDPRSEDAASAGQALHQPALK
jgi:TolA-binding protein